MKDNIIIILGTDRVSFSYKDKKCSLSDHTGRSLSTTADNFPSALLSLYGFVKKAAPSSHYLSYAESHQTMEDIEIDELVEALNEELDQ